MGVLTKPLRRWLKYATDPLLLVCITNQHPVFGEVIGNRLVRALAGKELGWHQREVIHTCTPERCRRLHFAIGEKLFYHKGITDLDNCCAH